jgi:hypothetical protein
MRSVTTHAIFAPIGSAQVPNLPHTNPVTSVVNRESIKTSGVSGP